ncbi:MAG: hypothetical protein LW697_09725, partial [Blastopirellula sp.]|nr:hypothetical protein [Blastopirellula sp.]
CVWRRGGLWRVRSEFGRRSSRVRMIARPEAKMWRPSGWGMELRLGTSRLGTGRLRPGFGGGVVVSAVGNVPFERQSWTSAKLV